MNNKICGEYICNYREKNGMALKDKIITLAMLWFSISLSCIFATDKWMVRIVMLTIALLVSAYIVRLKILKKSCSIEAYSIEGK